MLRHVDDKERRGKGTRAHGEVKGADGGAGDDPVGANRRRRSRWPEVEDDDVEGVVVLPSSHSSVELTGQRGGSLEHVGWAREGRWPWQQRAAVTGPLGFGRESERGEAGREGSGRAGPGCCVALSWASRQRREAGGGQAHGRARRAHASRPTGERWEMTGSGAGLGRPGGLPTGPSR